MPLIFPTVFLGQGGTTGFPVVRSTSATSVDTFANTHSIALPAGIQAGDLLVMHYTCFGISQTTTIPMTVPAGWDSLALWSQFQGVRGRVIYRIATGGETTVGINTTGNASVYSQNCYCFSAYSKLPVMTAFPSLASTASPNSAALTVPGDWGTAHACFISSVYKAGSYSINSNPSGYGDLVSAMANSEKTFSARRNVVAVSEDPGAWSTSAATNALPITIAVRGPE